MTNIKFNLRKVAAIVACFVITPLFWSCEEDDVHNHNYIVLKNFELMVMREDISMNTWSGARDMCGQVRLGGFSDWRLPTLGELAILYNERNRIGGFDTLNNIKYWSSTPSDLGGFYMCQNFTNGSVGHHLDMFNQQPLAVRCVRSTLLLH